MDPTYHEEVKAYIPQRTGFMGVLEKAALPAFRSLLPSMISPTRELGKVLVELACGDGAPHKEGECGVSGEGRTLNNAAMRRIAGI